MRKIKPINNNGSILLRFSLKGERYSISTKGKFTIKEDLDKANEIAQRIMADISQGRFDKSLSKYGGKEIKSYSHDLKTIWEKYRNFKKSTWEKSTLKFANKKIGNCLNKLPTVNLSDSILIRDWLLANKPASEAKRILVQFKACCSWAVDSEIIFFNPFEEMPSQIKIKKSEEEDINPFTAEERDKIIQAFENSKYYNYYLPLVKFIFYTGCRPSEAVALEWSDVIKDKIIFNKSYIEGEKQDKLKTQKKRIINLNEQVKDLIEIIEKKHYLIFPSKEGFYIDWHNFYNRAWRKVLATLPDIEYRNPYQMRHTFITLALKHGVSIVDIAKHCGNSPEIILKNYAGVTRNFVMPVF